MKKYFNISFIISITLIVTSGISFLNYFQTGCTSGRWGFGSCDKNSVMLPVVMLVSGLYCLYSSLSSIKKSRKHQEKYKKRLFSFFK